MPARSARSDGDAGPHAYVPSCAPSTAKNYRAGSRYEHRDDANAVYADRDRLVVQSGSRISQFNGQLGFLNRTWQHPQGTTCTRAVAVAPALGQSAPMFVTNGDDEALRRCCLSKPRSLFVHKFPKPLDLLAGIGFVLGRAASQQDATVACHNDGPVTSFRLPFEPDRRSLLAWRGVSDIAGTSTLPAIDSRRMLFLLAARLPAAAADRLHPASSAIGSSHQVRHT